MSRGWWNQHQRAQSPPSPPFQPAAAARLYHCGSGLVHIRCPGPWRVKIVANRFQQHAVRSTGGLRKEQAGFRLLEECNAQVATLLEIAARRREEARPTYVAFMDLQKAFDMIPHNGMLHVLRAKGVSGKCWSFIRNLYANGSFSVLVGPTTSELAPLERGVRQGDSLSPLLFNYVMNSCLDGLSGIEVPGLSQRIPGLLLADDAVIFADTEADMKRNMEAFGRWATSWHMKIGHDKCGLMVLHSQSAHRRAKASVWSTQGGTIPVVDQYTYLGLTIDTAMSTATMAEARASTGAKTLAHLAPFLAHSSIPVAMKRIVINGMLLPQLCYGAEVWGDQILTVSPVQRILDDALRLVTCGRMKNKSAISTRVAHEELDIANIVAIAMSQRVRAWIKWRHLTTWIADLVKDRSFSRLSWTQPSNRIFRKQMATLGLAPDSIEDLQPKTVAKQVKMALSTHYRTNSTAAEGGHYFDNNMQGTKTYLKYSTHAATPVTMQRLIRTRLNAWPGLLYRLSKWHAACSAPDYEVVCPSCDDAPRDDLHHIGMNCTAFHEQREAFLRPVLDTVSQFFDAHQIPCHSESLWTACLGGLNISDVEILQQFQLMWVGIQPPREVEGAAPTVEGPPSQLARETHGYALRSVHRPQSTNRLLITVQASSSPASSAEGPSTEEGDDLSADVSWMVESESEGSESTISTVPASSSSAAVPLWKRVGTYLHRVLGMHFQNIRDKVTQCVGSPPVRPRANAPFSVRQLLTGRDRPRRLGAVHAHVLDATEHIREEEALTGQARTHSRRQGVG